jgi:hypothetical protein
VVVVAVAVAAAANVTVVGARGTAPSLPPLSRSLRAHPSNIPVVAVVVVGGVVVVVVAVAVAAATNVTVAGARGTAASLPPLSRSLRVRAHASNIRPPSSLVDVLASVHDNTLQTAAQALLR